MFSLNWDLESTVYTIHDCIVNIKYKLKLFVHRKSTIESAMLINTCYSNKVVYINKINFKIHKVFESPKIII